MKRLVALFKMVAIICFFFVLLLTGCSPAPSGDPEAAQINVEDEATQDIEAAAGAGKTVKVVATIFPLADIVRQLGGEFVEVTTLLGSGASPHTFEPTVEQARFITDADLVFFIGGGLDDWAMRLAEAAGNTGLVAMMDAAEDWIPDYDPIHLGEEPYHHDHSNDEANTYGHDHGSYDPHIWLDPMIVKDFIAPLIAGQLQEVYPQGGALFQGNLAHFQAELDLLNAEIAEAVGNYQQKRFISYHSAWNYFARRYGLEEVAAVEEFPGKEPSVKWMVELVKLAAAHDITVIFGEPQLGGSTAQVIAEEIGGEVLLLDPLGGIGISDRESYFELMRYNLKILNEAMRE